MEKVSRRSAIKAAAAGAVLGTAVLRGTAAGDEPRAPKLWTLEGELKAHPKYLYRFYLCSATARSARCRGRPRPRAGPTGPPRALGPRPSARRAGDGTPSRWGRGESIRVPRDLDNLHGCP